MLSPLGLVWSPHSRLSKIYKLGTNHFIFWWQWIFSGNEYKCKIYERYFFASWRIQMWSLTWRIEYILLFRKRNRDIEKAIAVVGLDNISTTNLAKTYTSVNFKESSYSQLISNVSRDCWLLHTKPFIVKKKYMQMRILCKFKGKRNIRNWSTTKEIWNHKINC